MEKQSTRKFLKLLIALVALFLLAASALMLASCKEHVHQYELDQDKSTNATCNQPGSQTFVCPECGDIYVNVVPATGQHTWQESKVYPASCESEGWTVFTCSVCGTQKQDNWTPKLTHDYDVAETHEATCTTDGYQIFECTFCGDRYTDSQYTAQHPKLGHDWIVNETAEKEEDRTDADGWKVVKAANCLEAGRLERECARCGEVESKKGADATGHKVLDGDKYVDYEKVCAVDKNLVDAEGNRVYAFECDNENCPVNVVVDSRGTEKHYIKAVDHKMELDTTSTNYKPATCTEKGKDTFKCKVCDATETKETAKLDHAYNTIRSDGKTEVVVCIKDDGIKTFAKYMDFMKETVGASTYYDNQAIYEANYAAAYSKATGSADYKDANSTLDISCVCTRCGAPVVADGHKYIVAKYAEGSFTELEKDEEGALVDYSKEVAVSDMNCRYVEICSACGDIKTEGTHRNVSTATCRQGGVCEDCGRQVTAQLRHAYITIGDMIGADGKYAQPAGATDGKIAGTNLKWKDAYDAYIKVSATETWMVPVEGSCDSAQTTVTVCAQCLIDAAKGTDVAWNQATTIPTDGLPTTANATNAYVVTTEFAHDYELTYFDLSATDPATDAQVQYKDTSCQVGFKTAYVCTKCGDVYINAPVGDDPETENKDESDVNKEALYVGAPEAYTDAKGFVLDYSAAALADVADKEGDEVTMNNISVTEVAKLAADDHFGQHLIYLEKDYTKTNGYVAANCVETQKLAFVCLHCGTIVVLQPKAGGSLSDLDTGTGINDIQKTYDFATDDQINEALGLTGDDALDELWNDATTIKGVYDKNNHKNALLDCGAHCDAVNGTVKCSDKTDHTTITIDYKFQNKIIKYYKNYSLKVAVVSPDKNDKTLETDTFANHVTALLDGSKYARCSGADISKGITFTAPQAEAVTDWTKVTDGATYLVLVDEDGTIYQLTATVKYYTDDSTETDKEATSGTTKVVSSDTYYVSFTADSTATTAPVTASDVESLKLALANQPVDVKEGNVTEKVVTVDVVADIAFTGTDASTVGKEGFRKLVQDNVNANATRLVINLNGHKISEDYKWGFNLDGAKATNLDEVVFNNGTVEYTKIDSTVLGAFEIKAGQKYTFNAVTVISNASGIEVGDPVYTAATDSVAASWKVASLVMTDSTVKAQGTYGVYTEADKDNCNAATAYDTSIKAISLKNTNIIMNYGDTALTANATQEGATALNTAFYFDAPVAAEIVGGTFSANGQVVVVRAGSVSIDGTALNLYTTKATENTGRWDATGNNVSRAYITVGNNSDTVLQYTTSLFLDEVKFGGTDTTETVVYVASYFKADTITAFQKAQGLDSDEKPIMVYVDAGDLVSGDTVDYVAGRVENTTQFVNAGDITGIR